jgi:hypothetical protein
MICVLPPVEAGLMDLCMCAVLGKYSTVVSVVPLSITCQTLLRPASDVVLLRLCCNHYRPCA